MAFPYLNSVGFWLTVGGEELGEVVRLHQAGRIDGGGLLRADHHRLDQRARQHHPGHDDVHDADLLVVEAGEPRRP
jgi:hypothetical protein